MFSGVVMWVVSIVLILIGIVWFYQYKKYNRKTMGHLCYVYVFKYRALENIELVVDPRYQYKSNVIDEKVNLDITPNEDYYDKLFGNNVYSLTGIFGNNGSGKSSFLYLLTQELQTEKDYNDFLGILVFKDNTDNIVAYYRKEFATVSLNGINIDPAEMSESLRFQTFYFCNHFIPYDNKIWYEPVKEPKTNRHYNATDGALMITDFEERNHTSGTKGSFPYIDYVKAFEMQNHYRICRLLADKDIRSRFHTFSLPKYIVLAPKNASLPNIKLSGIGSIKEKAARSKILNNEKHDIQYFLYYCLMNCYRSDVVDENTFLFILTHWTSFIEKYSRNDIDIIPRLNRMSEISIYVDVISRATKIFSHDKKNDLYYIDIQNIRSEQKEFFDPVLRSNEMITSWCFDLIYCQNLDNYQNTILSAGELSFLNLFSRFYDAFKVKNQSDKESVKNLNKIVFLDEGESEFHPTWQQQYISTILDFFKSLKDYDDRFQIFITSHSPILLSDVPLACSNYYHTNDENKIERVTVTSETFAANIFDLMRKSFFMDQGMVGCFAKKKITELIDDIKSSEKDDDKSLINRINMIGDFKIKEYLMLLYERIDGDEVIKYYKERIQLLEKQKR